LSVYKKFLQNEEIQKIHGAINNLDILVSCHGRGHALTVVDTAEYILTEMGFDNETVEMGKTAALLHDIGVIAGRWEHAKKSAALARVFLGGAACFSCEEIEVILQAIYDHSDGENIVSAIGAAVIIGDKTDLSRRRIFPDAARDPIYKNLMEMSAVDLKISERNLTVDFIVTKNFDEELFIRDYVYEYKKGYELTIKAAKFLGLGCRFLINQCDKGFYFTPTEKEPY